MSNAIEATLLKYFMDHPGALVLAFIIFAIGSGGIPVAINKLFPTMRAEAWTESMDSKRMEKYWTAVDTSKQIHDHFENVDNRLTELSHQIDLINRHDAAVEREVKVQWEHFVNSLDDVESSNDEVHDEFKDEFIRVWADIRKHHALKAHQGAQYQIDVTRQQHEDMRRRLNACCNQR